MTKTRIDACGLTRREIVKAGAGFAAVVASGKAPAMLLGARQFLAGGASLPYDAEVEYLKSTGTQHINTGIFPKAGVTAVEFLFSMTALATSAVGIFGARDTTDPNRGTAYNIFSGTSEGTNRFRVDWSYSASTRPYFFKGYVLSNPITVSEDILARLNANSSAEMLGTFSTSSARKVDCSCPMLLGSVNTAGTPMIGKPSAKWKYLKIWEGDALVQHLIPVRVGSGANAVGYMYDRVTGELFGNAGTGAFVIGPDASAARGGGISANA